MTDHYPRCIISELEVLCDPFWNFVLSLFLHYTKDYQVLLDNYSSVYNLLIFS